MLGIKLLSFLPLIVAVTSQGYYDYGQQTAWHQQYGQPAQAHAPVYNMMPSAPAYNVMPPAPAHHEMPPAPAYNMMPPAPAHHEMPPAPAYNMMPPAPAYNMMPPAPAHHEMPPAPAYNMMAPAPAYNMMPPAPAYNMMPPAPAAVPARTGKLAELYNVNPTCHGPRSPLCKQRNAYYSVDNSCDAYVECRDYSAANRMCPDGMHFNMNATWPEYPCGYPMDVPCASGRQPQPANPTADCPHQYGFFASPRATRQYCSPYKQCVGGKAIEMNCTMGLAFNPASGRCEWPYLVSSCDADAFLGFKCPPIPHDAFGKPSALVYNYKYDGNCYYFFSCKLGNARLLACDLGMAFDPVKGACVNDELVQCGDSKRVGEKECDKKE